MATSSSAELSSGNVFSLAFGNVVLIRSASVDPCSAVIVLSELFQAATVAGVVSPFGTARIRAYGTYAREKLTAFLRSGVGERPTETMSNFLACRPAIRPSKARFWIFSLTPIDLASAFTSSTS